MSEEEIWEQMVQELRERRANRKKGVMTTAVKPTGSAVRTVSLDFASLYPNTMRMNISMKFNKDKNFYLIYKRKRKN